MYSYSKGFLTNERDNEIQKFLSKIFSLEIENIQLRNRKLRD